MSQQAMLLSLLGVTLVLFTAGRWRYDLVALLALMAATALGLVPAGKAFLGFGDPAVVTVAAVLVLSQALRKTEVLDRVAQVLLRRGSPVPTQIAVLTGIVAALSAFMNNVGALALALPLGIQLARREQIPPSLLLMPLAFGSLLGGTATLIGTPPNIILSDVRAQSTGTGFDLFAFAPVGLAVTLAGVAFIWGFSRYLVPHRPATDPGEDPFHMEDYISEVQVGEDSSLAGQSLREVGWSTDSEVLVACLIRDGQRFPAPPTSTVLLPGDLLVVEADPPTLRLLSHAAGLKLVGSQTPLSGALASEEVSVVEAVVGRQSPLFRRTARHLDLRRRYGINMLGVARAGRRLEGRLGDIPFQSGDVLLLQGAAGHMAETLRALGCLPLAGPDRRFSPPGRALPAIAIFGAAVVATATGFLPVPVAFVGAAAAMVVAGILTLQEAYESIDWSVVILLGAMLPLGTAMETSGAARDIASRLVASGAALPPFAMVGLVLVLSMAMSNVLNNAATAVLMAPIALNTAGALRASVDPFLMAVALGSTAAFLTPIGHPSNTLVMGPGGYLFRDYWRLGLPLSLLVVLVGLPAILWRWPLAAAVP
ncbi:MAG: SLC13 family permease [Deferrisomatales bacterium]|nr:SLC13 family permease [Deferrisomatales bacterium]